VKANLCRFNNKLFVNYEKKVNSEDYQFHQNKKEQPPVLLTELTEHTMTMRYNVRHLRPWLGTGTNMWRD